MNVELTIGVMMFLGTLFGGYGLARASRRWSRSDRALDDAATLRTKELEAAGAFRDELREENNELRAKLELAFVHQERVIRMESAMEGIAQEVAEIRARVESGQGNGDILRRLVRIEERAQKHSARFGIAGGGQ